MNGLHGNNETILRRMFILICAMLNVMDSKLHYTLHVGIFSNLYVIYMQPKN